MFLTAYFWGKISDRYGRKPVIAIGNLSSAVCVVLFGLADSYAAASAVRFCGGFFNGILGAVKTVLGESCAPEEQGQALLYLSISWGVGTTIGPTIGGVLSEPCGKFRGMPLCGEGELFERRPYLLPCLLTGISSLLAFVATLAMDETLRRDNGGADGSEGVAGDDAAPARQYLSRIGSLRAIPRLLSWRSIPKAVSELRLAEIREGSDSGEGAGLLLEAKRAGRDDGADAAAEAAERGGGQPAATIASGAEEGEGGKQAEPARKGLLETADQEADEGAPQEEEPWWRLAPVRLTLLGYGLVAFVHNLSDEVTPIFASAPPADGGLGFTTSQLGFPLAVSGVSLLLYAAAGYKRMQRALGVKRLARTGLLLAVPVWLCIPASSLLMPDVGGAMALLCGAHALKAVAATSTFTSSMVMINLAAPPRQLGQVNGMGQSVAAFVRGAGPALGGLLWSLSLSSGLPLHQFLVFAGLCLASVGTCAVYSGRLQIPEVR